MQNRETAAARRKRFRDYCDSYGFTYFIKTDVRIDGDYVTAKATVDLADDKEIVYSATGHKMMYFKDEVSGIKDTSAYSAAETIAVSRAMGFLLDGEEEISTEEDWNQVIIYNLSLVGAKLAISEIEARRFVDSITDETLKKLAAEHLNKLLSKLALKAATNETYEV